MFDESSTSKDSKHLDMRPNFYVVVSIANIVLCIDVRKQLVVISCVAPQE